jgi:hypothetical protein
MRRSASVTLLVAALATALALATAAALAARPKPKLPLRAKAYMTGGYQNGVSVSLVINATNPKIVQAGAAQVFGLYTKGGIYVQCPTAPKSSRALPFAPIAFPSFKLRLKHGHYVFSTRIRGAVTLLASRRTSPVAVSVRLTGTVVSKRQIKGTVKVAGAPCRRTAKYTATLNRTARVEPGQ